VAARARDAHFVLLGEKHDNPDHHRLQAWVLARIVEGGRRPTLLFEMLDRGAEEPLARYLEGSPRDAAGLGSAVGWTERGWPPWEIYAPIAEVALAHALEMGPADLTREQIGEVHHGGTAALPQDLRRRTGLDEPLPEKTRKRMAVEISEAHCNVLPPEAVGGMVDVQRARDAHMADRVVQSAGEGGAVLIAGGRHVRSDRGVPAYMRSVPAERILTVRFIEVDRDLSDPSELVEESGARSSFDLLWFTPRVDEVDPCERYRERLEELRQSHEG
jgi:uncharacterized iron-regulated protein